VEPPPESERELLGISPPVPHQDRQWFPAIEALRGVAAAAVVVDHCWALSDGKASFGFGIVQGLGTWGVNIFFMLSGYLLADFFWVNRRGKTTLEFYIRRFFRIAPAYYVCVGLLFLFFAQHEQIFSTQGLKQSLANLTFTQHLFPATESNLNVNGALWTLSIEMTLYLFLPLFAYLIAKRPIIASLGIASIGVAWRLYIALDGAPVTHWYFGLHSTAYLPYQYLYLSRQFIGLLPIFVMGLGLRWAVIHGRLDRWTAATSRHPSMVVLLVLLLPSLVILRETGRASFYNHWIWFTFFDYAICILAMPALLYGSRPVTGRLAVPMRGGVWLGERSYGLYLWHFPVILAFYGIGTAGLPPQTSHLALRIVGIWVVSIALAWGSFSLIERPGRLLGRRLGRQVEGWQKKRRRPVAVAVAATDGGSS
jgi:peptidoglycan/LPS O-acetylase OafA/YrhL